LAAVAFVIAHFAIGVEKVEPKPDEHRSVGTPPLRGCTFKPSFAWQNPAMERIATSVRIASAANALLSELAVRTGKAKAQVLEEALRDWEDRMFWTDVQLAFAAAPESDELRAERKLWERTVSDGLSLADAPSLASRPPRSRLGSKPRSKFLGL
jgi:hypothetical protein